MAATRARLQAVTLPRFAIAVPGCAWVGIAAAADILRRFTRANLQHPTYRALVELGKALRATFLCRYLHRMELRREIHEGLNVIESWNGANAQAAEKRLHTAQPSLSRQIRDLEDTLKVLLISRGPRGMSLTPAGQVFLEHARLILAQADAAIEAARRAHAPAKSRFVVGFLTGYEIGWLPRVLQVLGEKIELIIHSAPSPELVRALQRDVMDLAFLRPDETATELVFCPLVEEELFVLMSADHPLARCQTFPPQALAAQSFISFSPSYAPSLRCAIDDYLDRCGIALVPAHEAETLPTVISFVLSTRGGRRRPNVCLSAVDLGGERCRSNSRVAILNGMSSSGVSAGTWHTRSATGSSRR